MAPPVAIPTGQAPIARTIIDRDLTLPAAFDAQIAEADQHLAALLPRPHSRCCRAALAGEWSELPTPPQSATRPAARQVYRPAGYAQPSAEPPP